MLEMCSLNDITIANSNIMYGVLIDEVIIHI